MAGPRRVVIVGAGLAGLRCAETLRAERFEGEITLVGEEPALPYERPALSKEFLAGARSSRQLALRPPEFYAEREICVLTGARVVSADFGVRRVSLDNGRELSWDALVIATGARARRLPSLGEPQGVHRLRSLAEATALRRDLVPGSRLLIVGAGFVGAEVASTALSLGVRVAIVDLVNPMERALGAEVADRLARRFRASGAELHIGRSVQGFRDDGAGRLAAAVLEGGTMLDCDAALVAVGAVPSTPPWFVGSRHRASILVDARGRTSLSGVYACGDVACVAKEDGSLQPVEHWTAAAGLAVTVARTMLGEPSTFDEPSYFWSDQLGLRLQVAGSTDGGAGIAIEGDDDSFVARYFSDEGTVRAVVAANRPQEVASFRRELSLAPAGT